MESYSNNDIFNLSVDEQVKAHLLESGRWGKFLAIVGYIMCALMLLLAFAMPSMMAMQSISNPYMEQLGYVYLVMFILVAVLYFFPVHFLFKFSTGIKRAMQQNNQDELVTALSNQRKMFKFIGILTIVFLALYGLAFVIGIFAAMMAGM